jgi:hypothetical protein
MGYWSSTTQQDAFGHRRKDQESRWKVSRGKASSDIHKKPFLYLCLLSEQVKEMWRSRINMSTISITGTFSNSTPCPSHGEYWTYLCSRKSCASYSSDVYEQMITYGHQMRSLWRKISQRRVKIYWWVCWLEHCKPCFLLRKWRMYQTVSLHHCCNVHHNSGKAKKSALSHIANQKKQEWLDVANDLACLEP